MSTDTSPLGELAAKVMDMIADRYHGDDWHIRSALIVVEIDSPHASSFVVESTDDRLWHDQAILNEAYDVTQRKRDLLDQIAAEPDEE